VPEVLPEVIRLVTRITRVPVDQIEPDSRFDTLGNWTSMAALRLLSAVEQSFGLRLDLREYMAIQTVAGLAQTISKARP
jgi:acyl carrier protein